MIHEALLPLPWGPWDQIFNTEHWERPEMGSALKNLHSSQKYADSAFGGENPLCFICLSHKTRLQGGFWLLGFLRSAFYHVDLEASSHHTVCLWLLLISSWNYLAFFPPGYYALWEAASSKRIRGHLGILRVFYEITKTNLTLALGT